MSVEQRMVDLIEVDWGVLDPDFDPIAFQRWRRRAFASLTAMFGPDHVYTKHFEKLVRQGEKMDILAAGGILSAAQDQMACNRLEPAKANGNLKSVSPFTEKTRGAIRRLGQKEFL